MPDEDSRNVMTSFDVVDSFLKVVPVDLLGMAGALGLVVHMDTDFQDGESGSITKVSALPPKYRIDVNWRHSHRRKRFTLAHEISHFLLHRDLIGDGITDSALYRSRLGDRIETEANRMAAQLIMPAALLRSFWRSGYRSIADLCNKFEVSEDALRIRLKQLHLAP